MTPEELVRAIPFRYIRDYLTEAEALDLLRRLEPTRAAREAELLARGYPAYTTSTGWLGYDDAKIRRLCRAGIAATNSKETTNENRHLSPPAEA